MIYHDKILADLNDEGENRLQVTLKQYVGEWFLKQFGNRMASIVLLKDFLLSLKSKAWFLNLSLCHIIGKS